MRASNRIWLDSDDANSYYAADSLKGLLRDKGVADAEKCIHIVQRKLIALNVAMEELVLSQRTSAKNAGCECVDMYLATTERREKLTVDYSGREAIDHLALEGLKSSCVLEWRAKKVFAATYGLSNTGRVHPFDAGHKTYVMVQEFLSKQAPGYYKVLAAYETVRNTLNYTMKAYRKVAMDLHRVRVEAEGLPSQLFDKETLTLSRKLVTDIDGTGELAHILAGIYGDTSTQVVANELN